MCLILIVFPIGGIVFGAPRTSELDEKHLFGCVIEFWKAFVVVLCTLRVQFVTPVPCLVCLFDATIVCNVLSKLAFSTEKMSLAIGSRYRKIAVLANKTFGAVVECLKRRRIEPLKECKELITSVAKDMQTGIPPRLS